MKDVKNEKRLCQSCINGTVMRINNDILCRYNGAVSSDYSCSKHRLNPEFKSESLSKCRDCGFFIPSQIESTDISETGHCKLFTVRQYNGSKRNACSKFIKKASQEVS